MLKPIFKIYFRGFGSNNQLGDFKDQVLLINQTLIIFAKSLTCIEDLMALYTGSQSCFLRGVKRVTPNIGMFVGKFM